MPVVDREFQDPSHWASVSSSLGCILDGDFLRFWLQPRKGRGKGWVLSLEEWKNASSADVKEIRRALDGGAWCSVGLPPSVGLVRQLHSPFSDGGKSSEIWPSMLDAELPFALEECAVAFLPAERAAEGGLDCLASAARLQDVTSVLEQWHALDIHPDVLIPEALLLLSHTPSAVWMGRERTVITAGGPGVFYAAAGCGALARREKTVSRFQKVWKEQAPGLSWRSVGPDGEEEAEYLERQASLFLLGKGPAGGNLLSPEYASERVQSGYSRRWRTVGLVALLAGVLLAGGPLWMRTQLLQEQERVEQEISLAYARVTGAPVQEYERGQEVLLARRYMEDQLGDLLEAREQVAGPELTERMLRVFFTLATLNMSMVSVEADTDQVTAVVLSDQDDLQNLQLELEKFGDQVKISSPGSGVWRVEVQDL